MEDRKKVPGIRCILLATDSRGVSRGRGRRCAAKGLCRFRPRRDEGDPYTSARFMNFVMNVLNADTLADGYRPIGNVLQTANWGST